MPCCTIITRALALAVVCLLSCTSAALADFADPGPYPGGWRTVTITRANATTFTARLHYPAAAPGGQDAPMQPTGGPFPAIAFGHGFVQAVTQYQSTCQHLATRGYLVIAPESESGLSPSHANFALDMRQSLTYLEQQNVLAGSALLGRVNTGAFGMSGHSMGGGASILATSVDTRVKCLANMAAAETTPSAIAAMSVLRAPVFLITASQDGIVAPASNGLAMYNGASAPKQYPVITGGFHCGFTDATFLFCDSGSISRVTQLAITRRLLTTFFDLYLKGDQSVWMSVWGPDAPPSTGVVNTAAPGIGIAPTTQTAYAAPGGDSMPLTLTITNSGPLPAAYTLEATRAAGWMAFPDASITPALAPGATFVVHIIIRAPGVAGTPAGTVLLAARSETDHATSAYATISAARRPCQPDWNGTGGLTVQDIFDFLAAWFDGHGDFNGTAGLSVQDIFDFLASWFAGCG